MGELSEQDATLLRRAIRLSERAVENGNLPFGALLADAGGNILLEAENTGVTERNTLNHAETNLMNLAVTTLDLPHIAAATLYTSCEPCAMCSGAMYWGGINRMVYGLSEHQLLEYTGDHPDNKTMMGVGAETILNSGQRQVEVSGPHLVEEAARVQKGFWTERRGDLPHNP